MEHPTPLDIRLAINSMICENDKKYEGSLADMFPARACRLIGEAITAACDKKDAENGQV